MNQEFVPGAPTEPTSSVEISISCRNLLDADVSSRSDPMCVVYNKSVKDSPMPQWEELLRTEVISDSLNPDFVTKILTDYHFEEEQLLRFEIYDIDSQSDCLSDHDFLGLAESSLGQIVAAGFHGLALPLTQSRTGQYDQSVKTKKCKGTIILLAEEPTQLKEQVIMSIGGHWMTIGLGFCCLSVPKTFFTLSKSNESGAFTVIYKSESCPGVNPIWMPISLPMNQICNGDKDRVLQIQCFRLGRNGYHTDIGKYLTTFNKLMQITIDGQSGGVRLTGPNKKARLVFRECKILPVYTFLDYINNGTQIHCCFAVDFTSSNGDPNDQNSLHFTPTVSNQPNPYEQAIQSVGEIMKDYDRTQNFLVYGFGARIPPLGIISHKFALNFNSDDPFCKGVPAILSAYRNCVRNGRIHLSGPTNFAPIINDVAKMAIDNSDGRNYFVLVMITDGIITDMKETKEAIVNASALPLSIVIVGVGGHDFDEMEQLDGDKVRLSSNGRFSERDIVQFIPYRDSETWLQISCPIGVGSKSPAFKNHLAKTKLAREVLAEIPGQLTSFMKSRNFIPSMQGRQNSNTSPNGNPISILYPDLNKLFWPVNNYTK